MTILCGPGVNVSFLKRDDPSGRAGAQHDGRLYDFDSFKHLSVFFNAAIFAKGLAGKPARILRILVWICLMVWYSVTSILTAELFHWYTKLCTVYVCETYLTFFLPLNIMQFFIKSHLVFNFLQALRVQWTITRLLTWQQPHSWASTSFGQLHCWLLDEKHSLCTKLNQNEIVWSFFHAVLWEIGQH